MAEEKEKNTGYILIFVIFIAFLLIVIGLLIFEIFNRIKPDVCKTIKSEFGVKAGLGTNNDYDTSCIIGNKSNTLTVTTLTEAFEACNAVSCCKYFEYIPDQNQMIVINNDSNTISDVNKNIYIKNID
jgi:hypothetical protein